MTYTLTVPEFDLPLWLWIAVAALKWYAVSGVFIRRVWLTDTRIEKTKHETGYAEGYTDRCWIWLLSPALLPAAAAVFTVCTVAWPLSGGIVQPPWRWK